VGVDHLVVDNRQDIVLSHDPVLLALETDFLAGVQAEPDPVAYLAVEGDALASIVHVAVSGSDYPAL
jgi:hypothetical protein